MKRLLWGVIILVALIVALGFVVPHFAADRFGAGAQKALEGSLGRAVEIRGKVEYNLFTGPGFTLNDVVIMDDPSLSAEPILYADKIIAIPRIWPLFAGKLAFSSVRLEDAHINLGRTASPDRPAQWNVGALTQPALFQAFPNISVVSGGVREIPKSRINFRIGDVKPPFYIMIDRLEVHPPATQNGPWGIRLEGEPARTDRPALGFGSFVADGQWTPATGTADITVRFEHSEVSDIIALLNGHDAGIYGLVTGTARIAGKLAALKINGRVDVAGIHGFDQLPASQTWPLAIAGTWNLPGQFFELGARLAGQPESPVQAHFRVADYLGAPHWGISVTCHAMPLQPLVPLARQVGLAIPEEVQLNGTMDGAVSLSRTGPAEGSAWIRKASLAVSGAPPLEIADARLMVAEGSATLAPTHIHMSGGEDGLQSGLIEGDYDLNQHSMAVTITSHGMDIAALHRHAALIQVPVLQDLQTGTWKGQLSYEFDPAAPAGTAPGSWSGALDLQHATLNVPLFASPVRVASAHAELDGQTLTVRRIQARSGDLAVAGEYRYEMGARRPHRFHLVATRVTGGQLESLLRPVLNRGSLVSRAFGLKRGDVPDWLTQMKADGTIDVGLLDLGGFAFDHLSGRVIWDGPRVKLAGAKTHYQGAAVTALVEADLTGNAPSYHASGDVAGLPWKSGRVDADLSADTSGTGLETLANLRAEGSFKTRDVDMDYSSMQGCFQFSTAAAPRVKLSSLQLSDGETTFVGSGAIAANGELVLDLAGVAKPVRLTLR
jgi:hypothetical protein